MRPRPLDVSDAVVDEVVIGRIEKDLLLKALQRANGLKKGAASLLGLNSRSFRYRLQKHGIK